MRTDWHIVAGSGDIYEQGIDYPRSSGLPPHGLASSCHYGQLSFNGPFPLSLPLDPCPYVSSGTNGLLGTGTFNTVQSPATHSLSPLFPIIAQHSIPPGRSSAPTPLFIDTAAVPLTPACSTNSALEPGEVRSPISPRCGQDPRSCIQSRVYVREPGIASTKTVDPRRKNKPRPALTPDKATSMPSGCTGDLKGTEVLQSSTRTPTVSEGQVNNAGDEAKTSHVEALIEYCIRNGSSTPSFHEEQEQGMFKVWIIVGKERFELRRTYRTVEEGRQRVAKQVLARLRSQKNDGSGAERS